ncbi:MAG: hypothetical protein OXC26_15995 [Albidovulum sp.]|nr:hypothetical protein [Albidovulum sp.]
MALKRKPGISFIEARRVKGEIIRVTSAHKCGELLPGCFQKIFVILGGTLESEHGLVGLDKAPLAAVPLTTGTKKPNRTNPSSLSRHGQMATRCWRPLGIAPNSTAYFDDGSYFRTTARPALPNERPAASASQLGPGVQAALDRTAILSSF